MARNLLRIGVAITVASTLSGCTTIAIALLGA